MKKIIIFSAIAVLTFLLIGCGSEPNEVTSRKYNNSNDDWVNSIQETEDGGFIMVGGKASNAEEGVNALMIKVNSKLEFEWLNTFGGEYYDDATSVKEVDDGFVILGRTRSHDGEDSDIWLIKTDPNGEKLWDSTYGSSIDEYAVMLEISMDDKFLITAKYGVNNRFTLLIQTDKNGRVEKYLDSLDCKEPCFGSEINGEFVIIGNHGFYDMCFLKVNQSGNTITRHVINFGNTEISYAADKCDGGYIIAGTTNYTPQYEKGAGLLVKIGPDGNPIWHQTFIADKVRPYSVIQTSTGDFVFAGQALNPEWSERFFTDGWVLKTNADGEKIMEEFLGKADTWTYISTIVQSSNDDFVLANISSSLSLYKDIQLVKLSETGEILIEK